MSTLLEFVRFKNINSWSPHLLLGDAIVFNKKYTKKADVKKINIEDNKSYKILGVRSYGLGVFINREVLGSTLKMRTYQKAKTNHLFWCKVDTKNGAFGIITDDFTDALGSSNMAFSELDTKKIYPDYLQLFFKSKKFNNYMDGMVVGTTNRKYIKFNDLLNDVKIPLPILEIQKKIVQNYQDKFHLALNQEQEAKNKEKEIEEYLYEELEIKLSVKNEDTLLNFVHFKNVERWDATYLLDSNNIQSKYTLTPISSIINTFLKDLDNSSLRINSKNYPTKEFNYIGMENIEKETGKLLNFQIVKGIDIKSQTIKLPKNFFLYGKLRPYLNKYYLNKNDDENIIVSSEFFVFSVQNINEVYFKYILSSSFIQSQIENHMKGARMPRISEDTFKNLKLPLPPLDIQDKIADHITSLKEQIKKLKEQSIKNRNLALIEFEREIFNET